MPTAATQTVRLPACQIAVQLPTVDNLMTKNLLIRDNMSTFALFFKSRDNE